VTVRDVLVPVGTRPEIVKLAPVVRALREVGIVPRVVATGQHHDESLAGSFFADLGIEPDERWTLPSDDADRVGAILSAAFRHIERSRPDLVLVLGDTYTVPLFCLAARRHAVPVAHVEAGLRSFNERSMEEVDRRVAAATATLHFAPTELARQFLLREGVPEARIRVVGNTVVDALRDLRIAPVPVREREGVVVTAHRPTNVDDPETLAALVRLIRRLAVEVGPVTFPVHPRTQSRLDESGMLGLLDHPNIKLMGPVPYEQMLELLARARVVVTDSGGLQEEASYLGVPVVVLRRSTPRWEGVQAGTSVLVGLDAERAVLAAGRLSAPEEQDRVAAVACPYGDGRAAERIAAVLVDPATAPLLSLDEPNFLDGSMPC
jgi:UDP-N-acetylglucosamine 2-epimerase (non-hydrolysing)